MFDLNLQNFYKIKAIFSLCFLVSSYNIISLGFLKFFMLPIKKRREEKHSVFLPAFFYEFTKSIDESFYSNYRK